jgi:hypothetical protein
LPVVLAPHSQSIEKEEIVSKINSIVDLEKFSPYPQSSIDYWTRVRTALNFIPEEHQFAALCAFSGVIYLGERLLDEAWKHLLGELDRRHGLNATNLLNEAFLVAEDPANIKRFLHCGAIEGRLDIDKHPRPCTVGDVIRELCLEDPTSTASLTPFLQRNTWIILFDNVLSGVSLRSEIKRAKGLADILKLSPRIVALIHVLTDEATRFIGTLKDEVELVPSIHLDDRFSINNESCELFKERQSLDSVRKLCRWFYDSVLRNDPAYKQTIEVSGGDMTYGFRNTGLTLVTPNCPSNSLPILWYNKRGTYEGPYRRIESRTSQATSSDSNYLELLRKKRGG